MLEATAVTSTRTKAPKRERKGKASCSTISNESMPSPTNCTVDGHSMYVTHGTQAVDDAGGGHGSHDTHQLPAAPTNCTVDGHSSDVTHRTEAIDDAGGGQRADETQHIHAAPTPSLSIIIALWRQRYAWVKSRTAMTLAAQSRCRAFANGDKGEGGKLWRAFMKGEPIDEFLAVTLRPYAAVIAQFDSEINPVEKQLAKLIKDEPVYTWMTAHRGIGPMYIAGIVAEAGAPIAEYKSVSALWKRFGLSVNEGKADKYREGAEYQTYSSRRRSLIAQIESGFIMAGNEEYRAIYEWRKAYEMERGIPKGHAHNRAKRYMGKRFLRELWKHARTCNKGHWAYDIKKFYTNLATHSGGQKGDETHTEHAASVTVGGQSTHAKPLR